MTLAPKCVGLDAKALARRPVEPSTLSLFGLVRHMAEVDFAESFVRDAGNLDVTIDRAGVPHLSLREVLVHMIEEYARHNGHAGLLRERLDGMLGQ